MCHETGLNTNRRETHSFVSVAVLYVSAVTMWVSTHSNYLSLTSLSHIYDRGGTENAVFSHLQPEHLYNQLYYFGSDYSYHSNLYPLIWAGKIRSHYGYVRCDLYFTTNLIDGFLPLTCSSASKLSVFSQISISCKTWILIRFKSILTISQILFLQSSNFHKTKGLLKDQPCLHFLLTFRMSVPLLLYTHDTQITCSDTFTSVCKATENYGPNNGRNDLLKIL